MRILMAILVLGLTASVVHAEGYAQLKSKGFKTSKMMKSGFSRGWIVSKGNSKFFCKFRKTGDYWKYDFANSQGKPKARHVGSCRKR